MDSTAQNDFQWKRWFSIRHLVALIVCAALLFSALVLIIGKLGSNPVPPFIKDTEIYKLALSRLSGSKSVAGVLGAPIDEGSSFSGTIEEGEKSGLGKFTVTVKGPKGRGIASIEAVKADGKWTFGVFELTPKDSLSSLNLLLENAP